MAVTIKAIKVGANAQLLFCVLPGVHPSMSQVMDALKRLREGCFHARWHIRDSGKPGDQMVDWTSYSRSDKGSFSVMTGGGWPVSIEVKVHRVRKDQIFGALGMVAYAAKCLRDHLKAGGQFMALRSDYLSTIDAEFDFDGIGDLREEVGEVSYLKYHTTSEGKRIPICGMADEHLLNTIAMFLSPLSAATANLDRQGETVSARARALYGDSTERLTKNYAKIMANVTDRIAPYVLEAAIRGLDIREMLTASYGREGLDTEAPVPSNYRQGQELGARANQRFLAGIEKARKAIREEPTVVADQNGGAS